MRRAVLGSILALALLGCPGEDGGPATKNPAIKSPNGSAPADGVSKIDDVGEEPLGPGPHKGGATPQQCYRLMERAFKTKDFGAYYDQLSDGSQTQLLPMMTLVAGGVATGDEVSMEEFTKILSRHGIEDINKEPEPGADLSADPTELFKDVEDPRALFAEVMGFALSRQVNEEEKARGLENLKIEGDVATGEIVKEVVSTGKILRDPVRFARVAGRWFADVQGQ
jgi:hypothetical protein